MNMLYVHIVSSIILLFTMSINKFTDIKRRISDISADITLIELFFFFD